MTSTPFPEDSAGHSSPYAQSALEWDVEKVCKWIGTLGLAQYGPAFKENNISGDVLVYLGHSELSEIGVQSVGHRLKILKAIYQLIVTQKLTVDASEHYIPPTVLEKERGSVANGTCLSNLDSTIVHSFEIRDKRISYAENEIRKLLDNYSRLREDLLPIFRIAKESKPLPTPDPPINVSSPNPYNGAQPLHSISSPSMPTSHMPSPTTGASPTHLSNPALSSKDSFNTSSSSSIQTLPKIISKKSVSALSQAAKSLNNGILDDERTVSGGSKMSRQNSVNSSSNITTSLGVGSVTPLPSSEPFKSFRLTLDDPCYKVLPAALKKYKINGDWRQYALLVCYGDQERLLGLEEKPLVIFKELQDAGRRPVFMLRHIEGAKNNQGGVVVNGTPGGVI